MSGGERASMRNKSKKRGKMGNKKEKKKVFSVRKLNEN